jgi:hypothetical protein
LVDDEICGGGHLGDLRGAAGALDAQDSVPGKVGDEQRAVVESFHRDQLPEGVLEWTETRRVRRSSRRIRPRSRKRTFPSARTARS